MLGPQGIQGLQGLQGISGVADYRAGTSSSAVGHVVQLGEFAADALWTITFSTPMANDNYIVIMSGLWIPTGSAGGPVTYYIQTQTTTGFTFTLSQTGFETEQWPPHLSPFYWVAIPSR